MSKLLCVIGLATMLLSPVSLSGDIVIAAHDEVFHSGIGEFTVAAGAAEIAADTQLTTLLTWPRDSVLDTLTLSDSDLQTVGDLLATLGGEAPVVALSFALEVSESGGPKSANHADLQQLIVTLGTTSYSLQSDQVTVMDYVAANNRPEGFIQVSLPFDLRNHPLVDIFSVTATLTSRDGGADRLYLTNQISAVPEPNLVLLLAASAILFALAWVLLDPGNEPLAGRGN